MKVTFEDKILNMINVQKYSILSFNNHEFYFVAKTTSGDADDDDDEPAATPILSTDEVGELSENFSRPTLRTVAPVIEFSIKHVSNEGSG